VEVKLSSRRKFEPLMTLDDINEKVNKEIFLLVQKLHLRLDYVGCESIKELGGYVAEMSSINGNESSLLLIRGYVQDVSNLPFEVADEDYIFVIHDSAVLRQFRKMTQATALIEFVVQSCSTEYAADTGNFVIITGRALPIGMVSSLMTRVDLLRRMSGD